MPLAAGTRLGLYEIISPLGAGGMGEVYRAKDTRLGRDVALKVLPAEVASHPDRIARFEREARTVAGLNHPGIVVLYSVENVDGTRFLTMELVEGQTLDRHASPDRLPFARALDLAIALSDALSAAHEKGVVHRDLKPANVMVTRDGRLKVLDFGLAKLLDVGDDSASSLEATSSPTLASPLSKDGQVMGTAPYMAPEQLRGHGADERSDLFAMGILLYEMIAGRHPFEGNTSAEVSSAILRDEPVPLESLRPDVPGDLGAIVRRCLEKDPRNRFGTALETCNELRRAKHAWDTGIRSAAPKPASRGVASIAVLPFVNRSAQPEDEYFSDGLADELLNMLGKIRGLRVAARTSAFHFKGKDATIAEIGRALNVATILEGSVRKAGRRVRIAVQLVKVSDGYHLWSETYDRTLDDIFALQDDIAHAVVTELRTTLFGEEADSQASGEARADVNRAAKGRGTNVEAHRLYLQARHLNERRSRDDTAKGIEYLQEALGLDPQFALAWAELGTAYSIQVGGGWTRPEGLEQAREAVERALSLEPDLAEAHAEMGRILMLHDRDWKGAEAAMHRALEIAPGNTLALRTAGALAYNQNRLEEAIGLFRRAQDQDPLSPAAYHNLALALHAAGRFDDAVAAYRKVLELAPKRMVTRAYLSLSLLAMGHGEEAMAEATQEPNDLFRLWAVAIVQHARGNVDASNAALRELVEKHADVGAYQIAEVYADRAEADAAFEWLERAFEQGDPGLTEIQCGPLFRPLHADPRWREWVERAGFEG